MDIENIVKELLELKTYNAAHSHLQYKLSFKMTSYGDLNTLTAQACYVKDDYVIWIVYHWVKIGKDSYVSGDIIGIDYYIN